MVITVDTVAWKKEKKNKKRKRNRLHSNICTWRLQHDYSRILSPWTLPSEVVFHSANLLIVADLLIFYDHIVAIDPLRFPLFRLHSTKNLQKTLKDLSFKANSFPGQWPRSRKTMAQLQISNEILIHTSYVMPLLFRIFEASSFFLEAVIIFHSLTEC